MMSNELKEQFRRNARQADTVANPAAITSVVAAGATPTKAEYDALRADVVALRGTLDTLVTNLKSAGLVQ